MGRDIAPDFREIITVIPDAWLEDTRREFQSSGTGSKAMEAAILTLSVELLHRKWGGRLRWERTGTKA